MTDQTQDIPSSSGGDSDLLVNVVLAFCTAFFFGMIWKPLTGLESSVAIYDVAIFFGVVVSNPMESWRRRIGLRRYGLRLAVTLTIGALVGLAVETRFLFDNERSPWIKASVLVIGGTVFLALLSFERMTRATPTATEKAQPKTSARVPLFLLWSTLLQLGVAVILWSYGAAPWQTLLVMLSAVTLCAVEVVACEKDERRCWSPTAWRPQRKKNEPGSRISQAIEQSFASGLFVGGLFYLICFTTLPAVDALGLNMAGGSSILLVILYAAAMALLLFIVPTGLSIAALIAVMFAWSRRTGGKWPGVWVAGSLAGNRLINGGMAWIKSNS